MSMHSMMFFMFALLVAIAVIGGLYALMRVLGGRIVDKDHPKH